MYVSAWSKCMQGTMGDEFIGRGYFEFGQLKNNIKNKPDGQNLRVSLHDIQHGEKRARSTGSVLGYVNVRVHFLDPLKESRSDSVDELSWMLPKHRMQFALSKMGGRGRVSRMLSTVNSESTWHVDDHSRTHTSGFAGHRGPGAGIQAPSGAAAPEPGWQHDGGSSPGSQGVRREPGGLTLIGAGVTPVHVAASSLRGVDGDLVNAQASGQGNLPYRESRSSRAGGPPSGPPPNAPTRTAPVSDCPPFPPPPGPPDVVSLNSAAGLLVPGSSSASVAMPVAESVPGAVPDTPVEGGD